MPVSGRAPLVAAAASLAVACTTAAVPQGPLTGHWGGTHIGMLIGPAGTKIEYDCAEGAIPGPIIPRRDGRFEAEGTHKPGWGGPERSDVVLPTYRVRFTGTVRGEAMTLQGRVENGVQLGPFMLRRGAQPIIFACL